VLGFMLDCVDKWSLQHETASQPNLLLCKLVWKRLTRNGDLTAVHFLKLIDLW